MKAWMLGLIIVMFVSVAIAQPLDEQGWTVLTPPPGAVVVYVSSSTGSDANPGTQALPFASLARGYSALRDLHPDQMLLKCGDTWQLADQITLNKSAGSTGGAVGLNANDFGCFLNKYAVNDPYANCDGSQASPPLNVNDFMCFINRFAAGDTWADCDPSAVQYMVIGSYGSGPRPRLRFPANSTGLYGGNNAPRSGLAIVGLDLAPANPGHGGNNDGIVLLSTTGHAWDHVLIEDCYISGFSVGIVAQCLVDGNTFTGLKIRRDVIVDNDNASGGHAQGIFLGGAAGWLIEECVLDNNARSKADMFCHNLYAHELSGPGIFRGNISSRACSHGGQQRPGGTTDSNLFIQNPINFYQGKSALAIAAAVNYFRNNVALDSRDINGVDIRGFGFVIGGADTTIVENNIAAHQHSGTGNVTAFDFDGVEDAIIRGNTVYDWTYQGAGWGTAFQWSGGGPGVVLFEHNTAVQPNRGMCVRHEGRCLDGSFTYRNNRYFSTNPATGYEQFSSCSGVGGGWSWWVSRAGEAGSSFGNPWVQPDGSIAGYMQHIGRAGDVAEFIAEARLQSRQNWRVEFMGATVVAWVQGVFE